MEEEEKARGVARADIGVWGFFFCLLDLSCKYVMIFLRLEKMPGLSHFCCKCSIPQFQAWVSSNFPNPAETPGMWEQKEKEQLS